MGSSFVDIGVRGFWVRNGMLEIWLRLLALHLEQPEAPSSEIGAIRDRVLPASAGRFNGSVPHGLKDAVATAEGTEASRRGIQALLAALEAGPEQIPAVTLNLLAISGAFMRHVAASDLVEIGSAFIDLIDGRIARTAANAPTLPPSRAAGEFGTKKPAGDAGGP